MGWLISSVLAGLYGLILWLLAAKGWRDSQHDLAALLVGVPVALLMRVLPYEPPLSPLIGTYLLWRLVAIPSESEHKRKQGYDWVAFVMFGAAVVLVGYVYLSER